MAHRQRTGRTRVVRQNVDSGVAELVPDPGRPRAWTLLLERTPQSHVDLDDPGYLDFEYVRRMGHLIDLVAPAGQPLRALHLGAGGLTLARYVAATRPQSRQLAIEVDAALVALVRRVLPTGLRGRLRIRVGDARQIMAHLDAGSFDVLIADVFEAGRTPAHLTSAEFVAVAARVLSPDGLFLVNVADGGQLGHSRAQAATVRSVFAEVCVVADPAVLRGRRFGNLVIAASRACLPIAGLTRLAAADPFPGRVVYGDGLAAFIAGARPVVDADARGSPDPPADVFTTGRSGSGTGGATRATRVGGAGQSGPGTCRLD